MQTFFSQFFFYVLNQQDSNLKVVKNFTKNTEATLYVKKVVSRSASGKG